MGGKGKTSDPLESRLAHSPGQGEMHQLWAAASRIYRNKAIVPHWKSYED